ncbi:hypothetical protein FAZ65_21895 [Salmonella enterica subsp. enterica]|nr:hypothetical protein [Salmonella enterica]ECD7580015.1 hypothetical protein [Salmonella enterica subsp. enterica]EDK7372343.1 hypothetical protein [Salmonella enterica subsp. enterica serovar Enteritidis]EHV4424648.1 hypothetical protein [Salmonella enterica]EJM6258845.1 hypothetical protein [Salmonella enterica]
MLKQFEIDKLSSCMISNHLILGVELRSDWPNILNSVKVTNDDDLRWFLSYSIVHGRDLQSLFGSDSFDYQTLFVDGGGINKEFEDKLNHYGLIEAYKKESRPLITISFPEVSCN